MSDAFFFLSPRECCLLVPQWCMLCTFYFYLPLTEKRWMVFKMSCVGVCESLCEGKCSQSTALKKEELKVLSSKSLPWKYVHILNRDVRFVVCFSVYPGKRESWLRLKHRCTKPTAVPVLTSRHKLITILILCTLSSHSLSGYIMAD